MEKQAEQGKHHERETYVNGRIAELVDEAMKREI